MNRNHNSQCKWTWCTSLKWSYMCFLKQPRVQIRARQTFVWEANIRWKREISPQRKAVTHSPRRRTLLAAESLGSHPYTHTYQSLNQFPISLSVKHTHTHTHARTHAQREAKIQIERTLDIWFPVLHCNSRSKRGQMVSSNSLCTSFELLTLQLGACIQFNLDLHLGIITFLCILLRLGKKICSQVNDRPLYNVIVSLMV